MYNATTRQEPLEAPGRNSTHEDKNTPEISLPSRDNASPDIPREFPDRQPKVE